MKSVIILKRSLHATDPIRQSELGHIIMPKNLRNETCSVFQTLGATPVTTSLITVSQIGTCAKTIELQS